MSTFIIKNTPYHEIGVLQGKNKLYYYLVFILLLVFCRTYTPIYTRSMNKTAAPVYDEKTIKTLSSLEHIRLRPGMYIGRLGDGSNPDDGIYVLIKEVIDNSIDEFIMGFGKKVEIAIEEGIITVR